MDLFHFFNDSCNDSLIYFFENKSNLISKISIALESRFSSFSKSFSPAVAIILYIFI